MFVTTRVVYKTFGQTDRAQSFRYQSNAKPNNILHFVRKNTVLIFKTIFICPSLCSPKRRMYTFNIHDGRKFNF